MTWSGLRKGADGKPSQLGMEFASLTGIPSKMAMQILYSTRLSSYPQAASWRARVAAWLRLCRVGLLSLGVALLGCASSGRFADQVYTRGRLSYRVGALPAEWQLFHARGADVAFHNRRGGTLAASAQCPSGEDVPLDVLTNHLLFGFESQVVLHRAVPTVDGRQALQTHLRGEFDGVPIELELVVLKKDGCTYDLQLIASPSQFASRQRDFAAFVRGFTTTPGASRAEEK